MKHLFERDELAPGILLLTDRYDAMYGTLRVSPPVVEREIAVEVERYPFEAGELPFAWARRVVALVDTAGLVKDFSLSGDAEWARVAQRAEDGSLTFPETPLAPIRVQHEATITYHTTNVGRRR